MDDLILEVGDTGQTKLLLAVAPRDRQIQLQTLFKTRFRQSGIKIEEVGSFSIPPDRLLTLLLENINTNKPDALSVVQIYDETAERKIALYDALNFQRDAILRLGKAIVFWFTIEDTFELTRRAPDFWSRRTAVYHFDGSSAQSLISKLFRDSPIPRETFAGDASLSECLELILQKEGQLQRHINPMSELDVSRAKECQYRLLAAADQLLAAIDKGKGLEVTLWLWNLGNLDSTLQAWLSNLKPRDRSMFEGLYTDRNEIILSLAAELARIIKRYKTRIARDLGHLRMVSLLDLFSRRASFYLSETARKLASLSIEEFHDDLDSYGIDVNDQYIYDPRTIDAEVAAQDLENWLAGVSATRPPYLSPDEGDLLRELYLGKPLFQNVHKFGGSDRQILTKVEALEKKLRLRFGASLNRIEAMRKPGSSPDHSSEAHNGSRRKRHKTSGA